MTASKSLKITNSKLLGSFFRTHLLVKLNCLLLELWGVELSGLVHYQKRYKEIFATANKMEFLMKFQIIINMEET